MMSSFKILLGLLLVAVAGAITPTMTIWDDGGTEWDTAQKRTWHAEYALSDLHSGDSSQYQVTDSDMAGLASALWQDLNSRYSTNWKTQNGNRLISLMYDPQEERFWASTIPVGPRKQLMIQAANDGVAPAWNDETKSLIITNNGISNANYHAEDGVYFNWETKAPPARWSGGAYTGQMRIVTFGWMSGDGSNTPPEVKPLCSTKRFPSCRKVASNLGVIEVTKRSLQGTKFLARQTSDQNDWDVDDEDGSSVSPQDVSAASSAFAACSPAVTAAACQSVLVPPLTTAASPIANIATYSSETDLVDTTPTPTSIATLITASSTSSTPKTTLSCSLQEEDPDAGINTRYCVCGSATLPLMSIATTAEETAACAYTTVPPSITTSVSTGFHSTTTNSALCQICSQVEAFGDSCTTMSNCIPQKAQANVTVGTISPVIVGTLTSSALYTSISNALESICPSVTQTTELTKCSGSAKIGGITYVESDSLATDGELIISTQNSGYNETSLRDAAIKALALSAMNSADSVKNCWNQTYTVEEAKIRRDLLGIDGPYQRYKRSTDDHTGLALRDRPYPVEEHIQLCHMASVAQVNYYDRFWRLAPDPGPTDYILAEYSFKVSDNAFICDFIELLVDALAVIEPEFAVEDVELGEAIQAICGETDD